MKRTDERMGPADRKRLEEIKAALRREKKVDTAEGAPARPAPPVAPKTVVLRRAGQTPPARDDARTAAAADAGDRSAHAAPMPRRVPVRDTGSDAHAARAAVERAVAQMTLGQLAGKARGYGIDADGMTASELADAVTGHVMAEALAATSGDGSKEAGRTGAAGMEPVKGEGETMEDNEESAEGIIQGSPAAQAAKAFGDFGAKAASEGDDRAENGGADAERDAGAADAAGAAAGSGPVDAADDAEKDAAAAAETGSGQGAGGGIAAAPSPAEDGDGPAAADNPDPADTVGELLPPIGEDDEGYGDVPLPRLIQSAWPGPEDVWPNDDAMLWREQNAPRPAASPQTFIGTDGMEIACEDAPWWDDPTEVPPVEEFEDPRCGQLASPGDGGAGDALVAAFDAFDLAESAQRRASQEYNWLDETATERIDSFAHIADSMRITLSAEDPGAQRWNSHRTEAVRIIDSLKKIAARMRAVSAAVRAATARKARAAREVDRAWEAYRIPYGAADGQDEQPAPTSRTAAEPATSPAQAAAGGPEPVPDKGFGICPFCGHALSSEGQRFCMRCHKPIPAE